VAARRASPVRRGEGHREPEQPAGEVTRRRRRRSRPAGIGISYSNGRRLPRVSASKGTVGDAARQTGTAWPRCYVFPYWSRYGFPIVSGRETRAHFAVRAFVGVPPNRFSRVSDLVRAVCASRATAKK